MFDMEFYKFGGKEKISDVGKYLRDYLKKYPETSIYVGTDSAEKVPTDIYATVIAMYDEVRKDGVHYIFKKSRFKRCDIFTKMYQEAQLSLEVADFLEKELDGYIPRWTNEKLISSKFATHQNKFVTIDVDINPKKNEDSNVAYEAVKALLVGNGYRCRFKNQSWAANCAADMVCNEE